MVHIKRSIGFVQIVFGLFLIISTFFVAGFLSTKYSSSMSQLRQSLDEVILERGESPPTYEMANTLVLMLHNYLMFHLAIFGFSALVIILSLLMVFQGIAFTRIGHPDDMKPEKLGKIMTVAAVIILVAVFILKFIYSYLVG